MFYAWKAKNLWEFILAKIFLHRYLVFFLDLSKLNEYLQKVHKSEIGDVVILDADTNKVETPFDDLNNLPQEVVRNFIRLLPVSEPPVPYYVHYHFR